MKREHDMINSLQKKRSGATSLLIIMGLALLFIGIITGLTSLTVREQQQASDTDQSNRAIQAAEASARETAELLISQPGLQIPNCDSRTTGAAPLSKYIPQDQPAGSNVSIECQTVTSLSSEITGSLEKDQDTQILMNKEDASWVNFRWSDKGSLSLANLPCLYPPSTSSPGGCSYPGGAASTIEVTFFSWPKNINSTFLSNNDSSGIKTKTYLLVPGANGVNNSKGDSDTQTNPTTSCSILFNDYQCVANLNVQSLSGFDPLTHRYALRITSRYKQTNFSAKFAADVALNQLVQVQSSEAKIDVTARSGNLYRRIIAYKPIGNLSILDSVLGSGREICKNMTVTTAPSRTVERNNCNGPY